MTTHLGRVVYERTKHHFRASDVARILWASLKDEEPEEVSRYVVNILLRILERWAHRRVDRWRFILGLLSGFVALWEMPPEELEELLAQVKAA